MADDLSEDTKESANPTPISQALIKYFDTLKLSAEEREIEVAAYRKIQLMIEGARDEFSKKVHRQTLEYIIQDSEMKLTYCIDNIFPLALSDQRAARKRMQPLSLFLEIEKIIAGATHTSNFGDSRRWPLHTSAYHSSSKKLPRNVTPSEVALPADLEGSCYHFGVHTFRVGRVVVEIMKMIEKRYDLNFAAMEKARKSS